MMQLAELAQGIGTITRGSANAQVRAITDDSRGATDGCLFVARPGPVHDGRAFAHDAAARGAIAIATEDPTLAIAGVSTLVVGDASLATALLAERFFGEPSSHLRVAAVTGTNGKTTVVHLIHAALQRLGVRAGQIGTVLNHDGESTQRASLTTPGAIELSRSLAAMARNGCTAAAMEASSHALHQRRTAGLTVDTAVFTNLSGDHLDYHATMDDYADAKARLFEQLNEQALAIVTDHAASARMLRDCPAPALRCGEGLDADVRVLSDTLGGQELVLAGPWGESRSRTRLFGGFNATNTLLAAAAVHRLTGCTADELGAAFTGARAPEGRLDPVHADRDEVRVLVDFAHTDDALLHATRAVRTALDAEGRGGRLITVFGAGGDKDRSKRPRMGAAVAAFSHRVVITSDNPRTEDPASIVRDVAEGAAGHEGIVLEPDRARAIELAIADASPGDAVLIAGKGHEREQILPDGSGGTRVIEFSDHAVARAALDRRHTPASAVRP